MGLAVSHHYPPSIGGNVGLGHLRIGCMPSERRLTDVELVGMLHAIDGVPGPTTVNQLDPQVEALFGGISGCELSVPEFELCTGLIVRQTFAHVFAPYLMAFAPPGNAHTPHPGPWRAVSGGAGFDIAWEVALRADGHPTSFDRINTLWWVLALVRLSSGAPIRMPVISNVGFREAKDSAAEPTFWPVELDRPRLSGSSTPVPSVELKTLAWVKDVLVDGALLMRTAHFNRAFQTFDAALWAHSSAAAVILIWGSLETLFRPGRRDTGNILSRSIAALIEPSVQDMQRTQQRTAALYQARGSSVHDSQIPERQVLLESVEIARRCFIACIDLRAPPQCSVLVEHWRARVAERQG